mmetsp:Transcript_14905/g.39610  ORF Transcript_14905/g.39610 Transcript_14905/m.39610 type:complete len:372 (+) Transcript_14905:131-1246(+)
MPSMANFVRSLPNCSRADSILATFLAPVESTPLASSCCAFTPSSSNMAVLRSSAVTFIFSRSFSTLPPLSLMMARRMWAGSMTSVFSALASSMPLARNFLAAGEKGISVGTCPLPFPMTSSSDFLASRTLTPILRSTLPETPEFSAMTPTSSISLVTAEWPRRLASSCAFQTTFRAFSLNFSNIMDIEAIPALGVAAGVTEPAIEDPRKEDPLEDTWLEPAPENAPLPAAAPAPSAEARTFARRLGTALAKLQDTRAANATAAAAAAAFSDAKGPRAGSSSAAAAAVTTVAVFSSLMACSCSLCATLLVSATGGRVLAEGPTAKPSKVRARCARARAAMAEASPARRRRRLPATLRAASEAEAAAAPIMVR